jgi:hypothetical protein
MNAQLGTDLPQAPALGVRVGCTLYVHGATVTSANRAYAIQTAVNGGSELRPASGPQMT